MTASLPMPVHFSDEQLAARGLPEVAYVDNHDKTPNAPRVLKLLRGEPGFRFVVTAWSAAALNTQIGVTAAQASAMHCGSMMGWHVPGADPRHPANLEAVQGVQL